MFSQSRALWVAGALLSAAAAPSGALAATATGSGQAVIVTPTSFFLVEDMHFGSIVPSAAPGTVSLDADDGARSTTGGVTTITGPYSRGRFVGGGAEGQQITLTLSPPPTLLDGNGNNIPMTALTLDGPT